MKITFFGHADFNKGDIYKEKVLALLDRITAENEVEFLLSEYGGFDNFAYACAVELARRKTHITLTQVIPYINVKPSMKCYDGTVYPALEKVPKRFAIVQRNRWMVNEADAVIVYVTHEWGGAYQAYRYAMNRGKRVFNIINE